MRKGKDTQLQLRADRCLYGEGAALKHHWVCPRTRDRPLTLSQVAAAPAASCSVLPSGGSSLALGRLGRATVQ